MKLRDYQIACADNVLREFAEHSSTLAILPTGAGKTVMAAEVVKRTTEPVIFLAHREELLHQAQRVIESHVGCQTEYELADQHAAEMYPAPVLLASVQTMTSGRNGARRMHKFSPYNYGLIVVDEVHHSTCATYRAVLDYFRTNEDLKVLGITATPERADEEALGQIFESVAYDYSVLQAIKDGWLVSIQQQLIDIQSLDISGVHTVAGDLNQAELSAILEQERNLYGICDAAMRELQPGDKCIMFCSGIKQAQLSTDIFNRYKPGIALFASGKTPSEDRRRTMRDFSEGANGVQYFVNCNLVSEGFDVPDANKIIQARLTKSKLLYQQQLGRIMRPLSGIVDGLETAAARKASISQSAKPIATVIDFVGNAGRHKLCHAIDVLGGKISESVRELAERELRKTGKPVEIDKLVIEAEQRERAEREAQEAAKRAKLTGRATYSKRFIDPFDAWDIVAPQSRAWDRNKHLTSKQSELLIKQGIDPLRLGYSEGKAVLDQMFWRWKNGMASLKQCALLKRYGYDTQGLKKEQASAIIDKLAKNGWQKV